ncbi:MAG: N-acetylmuramoyl-L-alanine amidase [Myxococcaceae bacterium]|nr:N-acetylmuramoyl-L-alanine amidase [Myxococcaceae bacterium]
MVRFHLVVVVAAAAGCGVPTQPAEPRLPASQHDALFAAAGRESGVPPELLKALSYSLTRYEMVEGHEEMEGRPAFSGLMALTPAMTDDPRALTEPEANVKAAAAWLRREAEARGIDVNDLAAWRDIIADYAQLEDPQARRQFVEDDVFPLLGLERPDGLGVLRQALSPDYDLGVWRPSPNFNSRGGRTPQFVIIHTCEGGYSGCWSWQTNPNAQVAAHYTVKEDGAEVTQLVRESDRGWHVAAAYQCANNNNVRCDLNGVSTNTISVGIEHGGFASQTSFPVGQIDAAARLVCSITRRWNIPRDRNHILSHGQLQPNNRTDPGANWPWATFISKVQAQCADAPPSCDRTAGPFTFSCDGVQPSQTCVPLNEPEDPHTWSDNYLCSARDFGLRWSATGPIEGMECTNVNEPAEPLASAWANNYLCAPKQSPWVFSYSSAGAIAGKQCVHLNETVDAANSWNDNFLCFEPRMEFTSGEFTFKANGPVPGQTCVNVNEPSDPDTWADNYFCTTRSDVGLTWSYAGAPEALPCTNVSEAAEANAAAWADNFLCTANTAPVRMRWSSAGPVDGLTCVRWFEHSDTSATWLDNWMCVEPAPPSNVPGTPAVMVPPVTPGTSGAAKLPPAPYQLGAALEPELVGGGCSAAGPGLMIFAALLVLRRRRP